jgi:hypothetical protein
MEDGGWGLGFGGMGGGGPSRGRPKQNRPDPPTCRKQILETNTGKGSSKTPENYFFSKIPCPKLSPKNRQSF